MITAPEISPAVATAIEHIRALDSNRLAKRPALLKGLVVPSLSAAEQAAQGSAWLDMTQPGWHREISLNRLDLGSDDACIMGQLDGRYSVGAKARLKTNWLTLAPLLGFNRLDYRQAMEMPGFGDGNARPDYDDLTEAWHLEISRRLAADADAVAEAEQATARAAMGGDPSARYL